MRNRALIVATLAGCSTALLGPAAPAGATYPGANGVIAYSLPDSLSTRTSSHIWTVNPDGSDEMELPAVNTESPAWSADGRRIAYVGWRGGRRGIYVAHADGSSPRYVKHSSDGSAPGFAPSGRRIVFEGPLPSDRSSASAIVSRRLDGSHGRTLTHSRSINVNPTYSPNGRWIAWIHASRGNARYSIFAMHPNGSGKHRIAVGGSSLGLDWSPAGTHLAFTDARGIVVVSALGSNLHVVDPRDDSFGSGISYSPDGRYIAFTGPNSDLASPEWGLDAVTTDGQNLRTIVTNGTGMPPYGPAWQPVPSTAGRR